MKDRNKAFESNDIFIVAAPTENFVTDSVNNCYVGDASTAKLFSKYEVECFLKNKPSPTLKLKMR